MKGFPVRITASHLVGVIGIDVWIPVSTWMFPAHMLGPNRIAYQWLENHAIW